MKRSNFRKNNNNKRFIYFYNSNWFLFWIIIYGLLYYLSTLFTKLIDLQNYYLQIIFIGVIISLFARIIHSNIRSYTFKLNFNLFIWTLVYILLIFGLNYLIDIIKLDNFILNLIIVSFGLTIFVDIIKKKVNYKFLRFMSIFIVILIFLFNSNVYNSFSSNNLDSNDNFGDILINKFNTDDVNNIKNKTLTTIGTNSVDIYEIESKIIYYTNQERKNKSLRELKLDSKLSDIARNHSKDMAENDFFSHTNLKGDGPDERAQKVGYNIKKELGGGSYQIGIGENIGMMPTGNVVGHGYISNNADSIAKAQVKSWMDSPGHRQNILDNSYDLIGVGVAYDGKYYISTQNFK